MKTETMEGFNEFFMYSKGHNLSSLGDGDVGGVFRLVRNTVSVEPTYINVAGYRGPVWPRAASGFLGKSIPSQESTDSLNAKGATMIARTTPNSSTANLSTALGEVAREGLPALSGVQTWKNRAHVARSAGGEYLNVQFGWLPLLADLQDFAYAVKHHKKILDSYRSGSDKKIRRRYVLNEVTESSDTANIVFGLNARYGGGKGSIHETTEDKLWFSGCFRYHVPMGPDLESKFAYYHSMADKLLGVDITPEVVWNLSPWSWAADWFGNVGDVLHNISALGSDGLVLQYGYAMSKKKLRTVHSSDYGHQTKESVNLLRLPSTPYGFGFNMQALSSRQTAILVALGLSRT
jgi:hypothetical protein